MGLVSPKYSLTTFCAQMFGKDPLAIMDAASEEISSARRLLHQASNESDTDEGSKEESYCNDLQLLIFLLMNGSVPDGANSEFVSVVRPLVQDLLKEWEIGNLRKVFSSDEVPERFSLPVECDPLVVWVSRAEVETQDIGPALSLLKRLVTSAETAREFVERVNIAFDGYNDRREELFEIPHVRRFVYALDEQFPYWLFFLSKRDPGLQSLLFCLLPPFLTNEARSEIFPVRIDELLTHRWLPAMNQMCEFGGFSERQIEVLTERALAYITAGRFPPDSQPFAWETRGHQ